MFNVPVTYVWADRSVSDQDKARVQAMEEFAAAGARHLVLSNDFINQIMFDHKFSKQLIQEMSANGLSFADAHSPFGGILDLNCPDPCFRQQMLARHKLAIQIAASLEVKTITIHPGSDRFFPEIPLETHLDLMRDALDNILPEAEKAGVIVCIENSMSRAACPKQVIKLKKEYPTPFLGLCYDSGHAHQLDAGRNCPESVIRNFWKTVGVDEPEWDDQILEEMLPEIVNCHLHDNDGSADSHSIPGMGTIDWAKVIPQLKKAPKLQVIQCEVLMKPEYTAAQICQKFTELSNF